MLQTIQKHKKSYHLFSFYNVFTKYNKKITKGNELIIRLNNIVLLFFQFNVYLHYYSIKKLSFRIAFNYYSHSIVAGGFELISYTTLFTPFTLLIILLEISIKNSYGKCTQSAVIPSVDCTALRATTFS